jgi:magnesium transporter
MFHGACGRRGFDRIDFFVDLVYPCGMSENRFFHVSVTGELHSARGLPEALALLEGGGYLWLDFYDPTPEDLGALIKPLGIHPLSVEDCLDKDQIPKIDDFPQHTFILFNAYTSADKRLHVEEVDFILGRNYLITVSGHPAGKERFYEKTKLGAAIQADMDDVKKGPDYLLHVILDYTVDRKFAAVEALEDELDEAEELILRDPSSFSPARLMHLRRELLSLRKSLFHEREVLVKICRKDSPHIAEKAVYHFRDIYDHLTKFFEATEIHREMITSLMELYISMINNQIAKVGNRTNRSVRRLTVINTIFMPLTLLAGIGGMSEWSMMTGPQNWRVAYPLFFAILVVVGGINWALLNWFEERTNKARKSPAAKARV